MKISKLALCLIVPAGASILAGCGGTTSESIGGTVTGLSGGTQVVLVNNGGNPVTVSANGTYTFSQKVDAGSSYNVTVQSQPTGETCTPSNATGTVSSTAGAVTNINVSCTANLSNYNSVGGTVSGLPSGTSVILQDNGTSAVTVSTNGQFSFQTLLQVGTAYSVTVETSPTGHTCTVTSNGSGYVPAVGNSTNVVVTCK